MFCLCFLCSIQRPDQVPSFFGLHLWEVCMLGILKKDTSLTAYEAGILGWFLFNVVLDGCYLLIEHGMPLMIGRSYVLVDSDWHRVPAGSFAGRRRQKLYTRIWHVVVIARPSARRRDGLGRQVGGGRKEEESEGERTRRARIMPQRRPGSRKEWSSACGTYTALPDARGHASLSLSVLSFFLYFSASSQPGPRRRRDCRFISYSSGRCLGRSIPWWNELDAGRSLLLSIYTR